MKNDEEKQLELDVTAGNKTIEIDTTARHITITLPPKASISIRKRWAQIKKYEKLEHELSEQIDALHDQRAALKLGQYIQEHIKLWHKRDFIRAMLSYCYSVARALDTLSKDYVKTHLVDGDAL